MHAPASIACAQCGKPLDALTSYGLSVPVEHARLKPSDFCDLPCIRAWVVEMAEAATARRM